MTAITFVLLSAAPANADITLTDIDGAAYCQQGGILSNTADYDWWYGCSPTSAGMLMGYYDINPYGGLYYSNLVAGGQAESQTYTGTTGWSALANNAIASTGHVTDFYVGGYLASDDDLPVSHPFNCLADYMGTSQDDLWFDGTDWTGNLNGSTTFWFRIDGGPTTTGNIITWGVTDFDGMYGISEYVSYTGYNSAQLYTQLTDNNHYGLGLSDSFTLADYMAEIDAGRPVMLHVEGHTMFGYGYDGSTVYLYDTWSPGLHTMAWGESYSGREMWGVTVFEPTGGDVVPVPAAVLLGILGLGVVGIKLRKYA